MQSFLFRPCFPVIAGLVFLVAAPACTPVPDGNARDGERWFHLNRCSGCHGERGKGGRGPVIAGLDLSYHKFIHKLRKPNSAIMPVFEPEQLSDQDAADIYAWLKTLQKT